MNMVRQRHLPFGDTGDLLVPGGKPRGPSLVDRSSRPSHTRHRHLGSVAMRRCLTILAIAAGVFLSHRVSGQTTRYALQSAKGLELHDAVATAVTHQG